MGFRVAVLGATGAVGREVLTILDERLFPADRVHALASRNSIGREVSYGDRDLKCEDAENFDFSKVDLVLASAGGDVSRAFAERITGAGAIMIDNSSAFRMDPDVPLVVPEVNADALDGVKKRRIVANPNCSTINLVVALKPLHDAAKAKRVIVSTYQSVSGAGQAGMDELWTQTRAIYVNDPIEKSEFEKQIAFNVIPRIGDFRDDGYTDEEAKMWRETHKMIDPSIRVSVTCVRVPVFVGHSLAVHAEFENPITPGAARKLLRESPGLMVIDKRDEDGGYVTPVEIAGEFAIYVSRIRRDETVDNGLAFWVTGDNLRKGAALNAVQIAEALNNRGLLGGG
ncbi:MAG: aspartate-semialdehyde dehydrogenase [Maricaulaceae bacterium]|nr:aspartate-semialdehyde dehydrogenase [Maricaulaceae bacterium]